MSFSVALPHQVFSLSKTNKCSLFSLCDNFRVESSLRLIWILQLPCLPDHYCLGKLCSCLWSFSFSNYFDYRVYTDDYLPYVQVWCAGRPKRRHGDAAGAAAGHGTAVAARNPPSIPLSRDFCKCCRRRVPLTTWAPFHLIVFQFMHLYIDFVLMDVI